MVFGKPREPTSIFHFLVKDRLGLRKSLKTANPRGRVLETKTESKVNGQPRPREENQKEGGPHRTSIRNLWPVKKLWKVLGWVFRDKFLYVYKDSKAQLIRIGKKYPFL